MRTRNTIGLLLAGAVLSASVTWAVEPWADSQLTKTEGLALWMDAKSQQRARQALGAAPLVDGAPCGVVYDASGLKRHLLARAQPAQPRFIQLGDAGTLRFDGKDNYLDATGVGQSLDEFTLFIVAAPKSNPGFFRGLVAGNATGRNDYVSGFCVDLSGQGSTRFDHLNVEGKGFGGAVNLMTGGFDFSTFHTIEVTSAVGAGGVKLFVDGQPHSQRDRAADQLQIDDLTIGARFYSNNEQPAAIGSFLEGDVAEVLLYDRVLSEDDRKAVRAYLATNQAELTRGLAAVGGKLGKRLQPVANPPAVQMLVPGFTVRELPVKLTNINDVKYRADGKLVALAYDGKVYVLSDSDGDGLEDQVSTFWDQGGMRGPIGLALTPPGYSHGNGVFVPSKGKLSLLVDTDGDDKADKEIIVAQGWTEIEQSVDAVGVAVSPQGTIFFGLGTTNYANGYLLDPQGNAHFDVHGEHGTIQIVSPDFKHRETWCTGTRFPVAMALTRKGELFCTDQEGATWLPNGNPFDELLHIQKGRHYGFPPRHPRHLPDVIDEPSTFDFRPQHQSTCGLNFNDPVNGGPVFGPAWWESDAIVSGYSRGKIYCNKLVRTQTGYIANGTLLACLNMLTVDACVSPRGDLVVAVHSGGPDWGTGPTGMGKLYKVSYTDPDHPQPVVAWAAGPREVRIAFDRPLETRHLQNVAKEASILYGSYVSAGDRFESFRPGYDVVQRQMAAPRFELPIYGVSVTPDRRTLVLATDAQSAPVRYAVTLGGMGRPTEEQTPKGALPQVPAVDLAYDLTGVEATWADTSGELRWAGWLPHIDLAVAQALTAGSADHEALWALLKTPGKLTLRANLDLVDLLHPAVQPGSKLDYEPAPEQVQILVTGTGSFEMTAADRKIASRPIANKKSSMGLPLGMVTDPVPFEIVMATGEWKPALELNYYTNEDRHLRPLQLHRMLLPWARRHKADEGPLVREAPPELAGGSWLRGREIFASEQAQCSKCHSVRGQGVKIGPDLSNLVHRDYASVLRDIATPSFAINPDFISYNVVLTDGRVFTGAVRQAEGKLHVADKDAKEIVVDPADVEQLVPQAQSIMPEGLPKLLGPERLKDLLTYLLMEAPEELRPAAITRTDAPPPRDRGEIEAVLKASEPLEKRDFKPLRIVLVYGDQDHGINEHDYPQWARRWTALLGLAKDVTVSTAVDWPTPDDFKSADLIVWYCANKLWTADKGPELDAFLKRGGGMVYLHYAVNGGKSPQEMATRIGLAAQIGPTLFRHGPLDLDFNTKAGHPIIAGIDKLHLEDESYWKMIGDPAKVNVLATGIEEGQPWPLLWTYEQGGGRVFCSIVGHYSWTFDDPVFRIVVLRAMAWAAGEPIHRFHDLSSIGARIKE